MSEPLLEKLPTSFANVPEAIINFGGISGYITQSLSDHFTTPKSICSKLCTYIGGLIFTLPFILFPISTALKADGEVQWTWAQTFIPLWILDTFLFFTYIHFTRIDDTAAIASSSIVKDKVMTKTQILSLVANVIAQILVTMRLDGHLAWNWCYISLPFCFIMVFNPSIVTVLQVLQAIFVAQKLDYDLSWSWTVVLLPSWLPAFLFIFVLPTVVYYNMLNVSEDRSFGRATIAFVGLLLTFGLIFGPQLLVLLRLQYFVFSAIYIILPWLILYGLLVLGGLANVFATPAPKTVENITVTVAYGAIARNENVGKTGRCMSTPRSSWVGLIGVRMPPEARDSFVVIEPHDEMQSFIHPIEIHVEEHGNPRPHSNTFINIDNLEWKEVLIPFIILPGLLSLIFLCIKADGHSAWTWAQAFVPLWMADLEIFLLLVFLARPKATRNMVGEMNALLSPHTIRERQWITWKSVLNFVCCIVTQVFVLCRLQEYNKWAWNLILSPLYTVVLFDISWKSLFQVFQVVLIAQKLDVIGDFSWLVILMPTWLPMLLITFFVPIGVYVFSYSHEDDLPPWQGNAIGIFGSFLLIGLFFGPYFLLIIRLQFFTFAFIYICIPWLLLYIIFLLVFGCILYKITN